MSKLLKKLLTRNFPGNPAEDPANEAGPAVPDSPSLSDSSNEYSSRAFELFNDLMESGTGGRLLDLAHLDGSKLEFFGRNHLSVGVADLNHGDGVEQLRRFDQQPRFEGVLAWDFLSYIDQDQLKALGEWFRVRLTPEAPIFLALPNARSGGSSLRYEILDRDRLRTVKLGDGAIPFDLSGTKLGKAWPEFSTERSFLLNSGMQEFVFRAPS